jgi:hypothetical protein
MTAASAGVAAASPLQDASGFFSQLDPFSF